MRVVLDTNVVIAAFASRGLCAEIFEVCLLEHTVIMSEQIFSEVKENLIKKVHIPKGVVQNIMRYLEDIAETVLPEQVNASICRDKNDVGIIGTAIVLPEQVDASVCRDKNDAWIIGTAISGNARFIITGDNDLLCIRKHKGIEIINPRGFWSLLRQGVNK